MATNTTNTFTNHTGDGTEVNFSLSFSYILTSDIDVTVAGVLKTLGTHYTISGSTVTFTSGNVPANGAAIKFQRDTSISTKSVDFQDGSVLTEQDLDNNTNQILFAQQEIIDKLGGIEEGATGDQTNAEIKTAYEANSDTNAFTDAEKTKLSGIEASADVTDATNVDAAGAVMNSDLDGKGELLVGDGSGDPTALSVGTNGYVLKANSSTATGLEWAAESGGGGGGTDLTSGGTIDGDLTLTGANYNAVWDKSDNALEFADQAKATFGDGADLQIYHQTSGNHSIIRELGSGSLIIQAENLDIQDTSGNSMLLGIHDSYVSLAHHGDVRLATSSTGINVYSGASGSETITGSITSGNIGVTGNITVSGTVDGRDVATDGTKLDGIEASADVTDATNVASAGAVMDGDFTSNGFMKRTGAGSYTVDTNTYLTAVPSGYLQNLSEDSSPQLGANLDVQTNEITTSTSNGNIKLNPNGTGVVEVKGDGSSADGTLQLNCSQNSHGIKLKSPPHSAGASYTLTFPNTDGNANQVLKTDGSGGLDWVDQTTAYTNSSVDSHLNVSSASSGQILSWNGSDYAWVADQTASGISNLVEDTTPQLGGNLDMQANNITGTGTITANSVANTANGMRKITASTSSPSGGADGDIWIKYTA